MLKKCLFLPYNSPTPFCLPSVPHLSIPSLERFANYFLSVIPHVVFFLLPPPVLTDITYLVGIQIIQCIIFHACATLVFRFLDPTARDGSCGAFTIHPVYGVPGGVEVPRHFHSGHPHDDRRHRELDYHLRHNRGGEERILTGTAVCCC